MVFLSLHVFLFSTAALLCAVSRDGVAAKPAQPLVREGMPVKVANRTIIVLRGPIAGYTADDRARSTMERIEQTLESDPAARVTLADAKEDHSTRVLLSGKHAFLVSPMDIDAQAGETTQIVAREAAREGLIAACLERS